MIYWLLQHVSDVPNGDDWLSSVERVTQDGLRFPKRLRDWRLGRWTAKNVLSAAARLGTNGVSSMARISVCPDEGGVPCAWFDGERASWALSISHAGEDGVAAVVRRPALIGCDLESIGRRGEEFVIDYFTPSERALVDSAAEASRSEKTTLIWSAKESALKALGVGLRLDTRAVEVSMENATAPGGDWLSLRVRTPERNFEGWWRVVGDKVLTIVSSPKCEELQRVEPFLNG